MCFSLLASAAAGTTLSVAGVVTVKMARRRAELPLALIPLLFGVQQLTEGVVWWSLGHSDASVRAGSTLVYTLFAYVLWPVYVPFAIRTLESGPRRRKWLTFFLTAGAALSLYLLYVLLTGPNASHISGDSIQYGTPSPAVIVLYLLVTCVGALSSSHRPLRLMGAGALGLALVALWLYSAVFVSVWCFFSAVLTIFIFFYFLSARPAGSVALGRVSA